MEKINWDEYIDENFEEFDKFEEVNDNNEEQELQEAITLISKLLPLNNLDYKLKNNVDKINKLLTRDFLKELEDIKVSNEAQIQIKLNQLSNRLIEQKKYNTLKNKVVIGLGGKFSAGKSKFINSILNIEQDFLPENQNPTTSIPTYIIHGDNNEISAYTKENEKVSLTIDEMQSLTHEFYEKYQIGFSSFIDALVIKSSDIPYKNITFLDTPGYSKADDMNEESSDKKLIGDANKAYQQLKSVDYLIWLVDIENGEISNTDIEFISNLHIDEPILVVLNKCDKKVEADRKIIIERVKDTLISNDINYYDVVAYSSRTGEEWGSRDRIKQFIRLAINKEKNDEDILQQIVNIKDDIIVELQSQVDEIVDSKKKLSNVIFRSYDIKQIKTLIDIYCDLLYRYKHISKCKNKFTHRHKKLDSYLMKVFRGED